MSLQLLTLKFQTYNKIMFILTTSIRSINILDSNNILCMLSQLDPLLSFSKAQYFTCFAPETYNIMMGCLVIDAGLIVRYSIRLGP